jgi:hypothetical protein
MKQLKHLKTHLQHTYITIATYATSGWNTCNIRLKQRNIWNIHLQHMCIAIATYATPNLLFTTYRWNICNIHLKHMKHTVATYAHLLTTAQWRLTQARGSAAWGVGGARHETRVAGVRHGWVCVARDAHGARHVRCDRARREVQGRTTRGGSAPSGWMDVLVAPLIQTKLPSLLAEDQSLTWSAVSDGEVVANGITKGAWRKLMSFRVQFTSLWRRIPRYTRRQRRHCCWWRHGQLKG